MASEPKTKPTDVPVADFLATVPDAKRRADAETLVPLFEAVTGEKAVMWGPSIVGFGLYRYVYASGQTGDWPVLGFSPRKANLVVYMMDGYDGHANLLARLGKHKIGKSCLYLNGLKDVDLSVLRELATRSVAATRARWPVS